MEQGQINGYARNLCVQKDKQGNYSTVCNAGFWKQVEKKLIPNGKFAQITADANKNAFFKIPFGIYLGSIENNKIRVQKSSVRKVRHCRKNNSPVLRKEFKDKWYKKSTKIYLD